MRPALLLLAGFGVGLLLFMVVAMGVRAENADHERHEEDR